MIGNNCGHIPVNPRWFSPPEKHTRPFIIKKAIEQVRDYYFDPAATIPTLNFANESNRRQRSERRESCVSVLGCLLHYLDLATMRVGIPQHDLTFKGITMLFIAEKCGMSLRRIERAVADLVESGLVTVHPLCEKISDAVYKGFAAIRTIDKKLFAIFGMDKQLQYEREKAAQRQKKKARKAEAKGKAKVGLALKGLAQNFVADPEKGSIAKQTLNAIKDFLNSS
jgi:hypothetical protein